MIRKRLWLNTEGTVKKKVKESMQKIGTGICLKNTSKKIKKYGREYRENMSEEDKQKKRKNTLKNTWKNTEKMDPTMCWGKKKKKKKKKDRYIGFS